MARHIYGESHERGVKLKGTMNPASARLLTAREQTARQYVAVEFEGRVICHTDTFEKAERILLALRLIAEVDRGERLLFAAPRVAEAAD